MVTSVTHEEAEQAMAAFAQCNTQLKLIGSRMEDEKQQINNKYLGDITRLKDSMDEQMSLLQVYGQQYKNGWKGKSLALIHGKIGFRTGAPKLVKDRKFTWDAVTELLKKAFPAFVRTSYEINKEALIAFREDKEFGRIKEKKVAGVIRPASFNGPAVWNACIP